MSVGIKFDSYKIDEEYAIADSVQEYIHSTPLSSKGLCASNCVSKTKPSVFGSLPVCKTSTKLLEPCG